MVDDVRPEPKVFHLDLVVDVVGAELVEHCQPLLLVLGLGHPELLLVLHHVSQHSAADEHLETSDKERIINTW